MAFYEDLVKKEEKSSAIKARIIDFVLFLYIFSGILYFLRAMEWLSMPFSQTELIVCAVVALILAFVIPGPMSLSHILIFRNNKVLKTVYRTKLVFRFKSLPGLVTAVLVVVTFALSVLFTGFSFVKLLSDEGMSGARRIFAQLFNPNFAILENVLSHMVETIFTAFLATFLAIPIAFLLSFFASMNLMRGSKTRMSIYTGLRILSNLTRSIEPLIWAIIFSVWVGIGPFAGMLSLMLHSIASLIKQYSEQIESINYGPVEAMEATGANRVQMVWYAVVPQVILPFLSYTIYRWDINIRMATVIGLVGGGGVGTLLMQYQGLAKWNEVGTIVIVIALVVWAMDYFSAKLRESIY